MKNNVFAKIIIFILFPIMIFIGIVFFVSNILYPLKYKEDILETAKRYNIESSLIASVINAESSFKENAISKKGAVGLMQIMPNTARWVAKIIKIENFSDDMLLNPKTNIEIGTFYLCYLIDKFGNVNTALSAYNAGEGVVLKWLKKDEYSVDKITLSKVPYTQTEKYVKKINSTLNYYRAKLN